MYTIFDIPGGSCTPLTPKNSIWRSRLYIDRPTSSWVHAEKQTNSLIAESLYLHLRSMLAEGSCDYVRRVNITNLKNSKIDRIWHHDFLETHTTLRGWRRVCSLRFFIRILLCFRSWRRLLVKTFGTRFISSDRPGLFLLCTWFQLFSFTTHFIESTFE